MENVPYRDRSDRITETKAAAYSHLKCGRRSVSVRHRRGTCKTIY